MKRWLPLAVPIFLLFCLSYVGCLLDHAKRGRLEAEDRAAALELEKAGLQKALSVKPTELLKFVDHLIPYEVVKLVHDKQVVPVTAVKIETRDVPFELPCGPTDTVKSTVSVTGGFFLGTSPLGQPFWRKELKVHIHGLPAPIDFSEDPGIQLEISDHIRDLILRDAEASSRLRLSPRPLREWRTGMTLGAGLCQPFLPTGHPATCAAFLWGVQM